VFAGQELEALRRFSGIGREELFRFFMLASVDIASIDPGRGRGGRLGLAVALCALPWLGFVPDDVAAVPRVLAQLTWCDVSSVACGASVWLSWRRC
jgi:hypothetical protein